MLFGDYPTTWTDHGMDKAAERFRTLPLFINQVPIPVTTYLLFVRERYGLASAVMRIPQALTGEELLAEFAGKYTVRRIASWESAWGVDALKDVDLDNRTIALETVGGLREQEDVIEQPQMQLTAIFRYVSAMELNNPLLIGPQVRNEAVLQLRRNPYNYYAYGPEAIPRMPLEWSAL